MTSPSSDSDRVVLSVGGTLFATTRGTLLARAPDSFFVLFLDPASPFAAAARGGGGAVFVDRSAAVFHLVLEYLRHGVADMAWPDSAWLSQETVALVGRDAAFYLLEELEGFCLRLSLLRGWHFPLVERPMLAVEAARGSNSSGSGSGGGRERPWATLEGLGCAGGAPLVGRRWLARRFPGLLRQILRVPGLNSWESPVRIDCERLTGIERRDCVAAVLRFAALCEDDEGEANGDEGSESDDTAAAAAAAAASASWELARPAAHVRGRFCFVSTARIEVQRLFDGAEAARRSCLSGPRAEAASPGPAGAATGGGAVVLRPL